MNTKELYEKLIQMPDLHSLPVLEGDVLIWELYKNADVHACCGGLNTIIEIMPHSVLSGAFHWHPDEEDMPEELYMLGKKGNILVLKNFLMGVGIYYMGEPETYRFSPKKKWHWGKLTYLEQK